MNSEPINQTWQKYPAEVTPPPVHPAPIIAGLEMPTWCACGIHRATTRKPLCPVCLDSATEVS